MTAEFHKANRQRLYAEMKNGSAAAPSPLFFPKTKASSDPSLSVLAF